MKLMASTTRCQYCLDLLTQLLSLNGQVGDKYVHWHTFGELETSSMAGCDLCALLRQKLVFRFSQGGAWPDSKAELSLERGNQYGSVPGYFESEEDIRSLSMHCGASWGTSWETIDYVVGSGIMTPTGTAAISGGLQDVPLLGREQWPTEPRRQLVLQWIDTCIKQHDCSHVQAGDNASRAASTCDTIPELPTRVIDISLGEGSVRLVVSNGIRAQYMALSYCWGLGPHTYVTTTGNLEERCQHMDIEVLPRTIQEAIRIARGLGVDYLWVDALCILQPTAAYPDLSDWAREASRMASVYEHAMCTISASSAENTDDGCFTAWPAVRIPARPCAATDHESGRKIIIEHEDPDWHHAVSYAPLGRRAWVLQEDLMSPRTIYWTKYGLYWWCRQLRASERDVTSEGLNGSGGFGWAAKKEKAMRQITTGELTELSWLRIVERYSTRALTNTTDKLVAISGLASVIQRHTNDTYLAGLWKSRLVQGLSWRCGTSDRDDDVNIRRYKECIAPSWSWASIPGQIWWPSAGDLGDVGTYTWDAEVVEAEVELAGSDLLGQVKGGRVRLRGCMRTICAGRKVTPRYFFAALSADADNSYAASEKTLAAEGWKHPGPECFGSLWFDEMPEQYHLGLPLQCLQTSTMYSSQVPGRSETHGLLLRPTGRLEGEYVRIGFFELPSRISFMSNSKEVVDIV